MSTFTKVFFNAAVLTLALLFAQTAGAQLMPNDLCANATTVTCGQTVSGNTNNSTIDTAPTCGLTFPRYGVWYRFVGTGQTVTLSTCNVGTNYDTQIGVYSGSCTALNCVAGNNNDATCTRSGRYSTVTFNSVSGTNYYIWVTGVLSARGNFSMTVSCTGGVGVANDACANAILMNCNTSVTGTTVGATSDAVATCGTSLNTAPGVWYRFVGNGGSVTVSTCNPGTNYDTKLGVFSGSCTGLVCVGGNDDTTAPECVLPATGFNRKSRVTFQSVNGTTYYVLVTGFSTLTGNFELSVSCASTPPPSLCICSNGTPYLTATAPSTPTTVNISSCTFAGEYNTINGAVAGVTYTVTSSIASDYLTVRQGSAGGTVLGCGTTPLTVTPTASGPIYLHVNTNSACGSASSCRATTITCSSCTTITTDPSDLLGVNVNGVTPELNVSDFYPNPAQNGLSMLDINSNQDGEAVITLFDALGRIVSDRKEGVSMGFNQLRLNVASLATGTYFAVVSVNGQQFHKKLVVTR